MKIVHEEGVTHRVSNGKVTSGYTRDNGWFVPVRIINTGFYNKYMPHQGEQEKARRLR